MDYSMPLSMLFTKMENRSEVDDKREIEVYNNHMLNIRFWFIRGKKSSIYPPQYYICNMHTGKDTRKDYAFRVEVEVE